MRQTNGSMLKTKSATKSLVIIYAVILSLLLLAVATSHYFQFPIEVLTRDTSVILGGHPLTGLFSNIGIVVWCSTAAICLFSSRLLKINGQLTNARFLMFFGLLTTILMLDDLLMLHEGIFPDYFYIPEKAVYLSYLVLTATCLLTYRKLIGETEYGILFIACAFFASSIASDVLLPQKGLEFLVEDGLKLFGIVTWLVYFFRTSLIELNKGWSVVLLPRDNCDSASLVE